MKKWNAPEVESLDVKLTATGSDPSTEEAAGGFGVGGWRNATYPQGSNLEQCDNGSKYNKTNVES